MFSLILEADLGIWAITVHNGNVFYELGSGIRPQPEGAVAARLRSPGQPGEGSAGMISCEEEDYARRLLHVVDCQPDEVDIDLPVRDRKYTGCCWFFSGAGISILNVDATYFELTL